MAPIGQLLAHLPQEMHLAGSRRGRKCGGAITAGALNSLTVRIAWQQQPQHEHEHWPLVDCTFMIQLTSPCDSASRLISRASFLETRRIDALPRCPARPIGP